MTTPDSQQDEQLMQRILQRDDQAVTELYQQYGSLVYSLALRICQNIESAQEVTQDTFLKVWRQSDRWDAAKGRLVVWLLTITRYTAIDYLRRESRQPQTEFITLDDLAETLGKQTRVDDAAWLDRRISPGTGWRSTPVASRAPRSHRFYRQLGWTCATRRYSDLLCYQSRNSHVGAVHGA